MTAALIRKYLTQDMNDDEKHSYIEYCKGDENSTEWMEKALIRREPILLAQLKCKECSDWIDMKYNGICKCSNGHECYNEVIEVIKN
jgi:hypothetical protein